MISLEIIKRRRDGFYRLYREALTQARRVAATAGSDDFASAGYAAWASDVVGHRTRAARFCRLWHRTCRQLRGIDYRARRVAREGLL